jgi:hypothetical protein
MAVHPDGTVHAAEQDEKEEPVSEEPPEGTWYVRQGDDIYGVWPDGSTHLVPQEKPEPEPEPERGFDDGILSPQERRRGRGENRAQDVGLQFTRETGEGTETLPVDSSVPRCAEDRGAWGGAPEGRDADDGFEAYQARTDELDRRVAAGESITDILQQEHLARMKERLREIYRIETSS